MGNTASTTSTTNRRSHRRRLRSHQPSAPPSNPPPPAYYQPSAPPSNPPPPAYYQPSAEVENGYPSGPVVHKPAPYVEHEKAVTIRNVVNLKRETLRMEPDEGNPTKYLVAFTFDATVACSITIIFFAKEEEDCYLSPTKENLFAPVTVHFQQGLGQKFKQPSGTGIDFSLCEEIELLKADVVDLYPLAVKAEASPSGSTDRNGECGATNSQITRAVFEKQKGEYGVRVVKQFLWVNGNRYELQEIYGIGNSADGDADSDGNEIGKECVICLSEPQDTTVLPCRHMCMCSGCAKVLRFKTDRCPICRQPVERLLEIKVNSNGSQDN